MPLKPMLARHKRPASPREIEAQALLMAARKLQEVQTNWTGPDKNMHKALLFNRRLWSIFMSAAEANDNPQPVEVRQNIANIGVFVMQRDDRNAADPDPSKLKSLIDINCNIAAGLAGRAVTGRTRTRTRMDARRISDPAVGTIDRTLTSGRAVGGDHARRIAFGQVERVEIGAAAQHRLVGILLYHRVRLAIDDLIDDRGRGLIEKRLMRYGIARYRRMLPAAGARRPLP